MTAIQTHVKTMVFVKTELMTTHVIAILDSLEITVKHVRMHYPLVSEYHIKLQNDYVWYYTVELLFLSIHSYWQSSFMKLSSNFVSQYSFI